MEKNLYCSMIHGGLELKIKKDHAVAQQCCLRSSKFPVDINTNYWFHPKFKILRNLNKKNEWSAGCQNCQVLESAGIVSLRNGMNRKFGNEDYDLPGPKRIDLYFDQSCNLACRICTPESSTFWQKHLQEHKINFPLIPGGTVDHAILALSKLDLSNLGMVVFCGGETLLGQSWWKVAEWLAQNVPNAQQQLTLCFQTNGTQSISERNRDLINRFHLVRLQISLDGVGNKFNYQRWPAEWNQVVDNIMSIRDSAPSNTMFLIEETISIFNLYYQSELANWVSNNFCTNREGDIVDHTRHLVHGIYGLQNCSENYVHYLRSMGLGDFIPDHWQENKHQIQKMIAEIKQFDILRNQSFEKTFPEVAEFYSQWL